MEHSQLPSAGGVRPHPVAGAPLMCNALEHGLTGNGTTNDQPALAALVDRMGDAYAADGRVRAIYCPPGVYLIRDAGTAWRSGVSLVGAGPGATRFVLSNAGDRTDPAPLAFHTATLHGADRERHLAYCTFADFEIDGSGVASADYNPLAKGLDLQYVVRGVFRNLYIHHTAATGLGCDFLQDCLIDGVLVVGCGRMDNGTEMGGAAARLGQHPGEPDLGQPAAGHSDPRDLDHRAGQLRGLPGRGQRPGRERRGPGTAGHPADRRPLGT